jgi:hypothetical protein
LRFSSKKAFSGERAGQHSSRTVRRSGQRCDRASKRSCSTYFGALQGATPAQAFFVRCDATTMTQAEIDAGLANVIIGMAVVRPAEFIIMRIQQRASKTPP